MSKKRPWIPKSNATEDEIYNANCHLWLLETKASEMAELLIELIHAPDDGTIMSIMDRGLTLLNSIGYQADE